jgi:hypothetical protein
VLYSGVVPYRDLEPISKQLTIVVGLTVVGFMAFGLALSFYRNVLFEETLKQLSVQNDELRRQNAVSQDDLEYYRSAQYRDKYAKEHLGKIRPGEKALVILTAPKTPVLDSEVHDTVTEQQQAAFEALLRTMPVIEHWQLYLFHKNKIEELKKSL